MRVLSQNEESSYSRAYREYVQFFNQLTVLPAFSTFFLAIPSILLITDLIHVLGLPQQLLIDFKQIGITVPLFELAQNNQIVVNLIITFQTIILTVPIWIIILIVLTACENKKQQKRSFKQLYEHSWIHNIFRAILVGIPLIILPFTISLSIKFATLPSKQIIRSIVIIILAFLNCFLVEYHTFELTNSQKRGANLTSVNFPSKLIDDVLLSAALIGVNVTTGIVTHIIAFSLVFLRFLLIFYSPFYAKNFIPRQKIVLLGTLIIIAAIAIAYFNKSYYLSLFIGISLIILVTRSPLARPIWQKIDQEEGLMMLRKSLWEQGLFARCFKKLIFLSRQNNSHRIQLEILILKSHCALAQQVDRGGLRICGADQVVFYETQLLKFVENLISAADLSISVLKLLQQKQPKTLVFGKAVSDLMEFFISNKLRSKRLLQLHQQSKVAYFLILKTYGELCVDKAFLTEIKKSRIDSQGLGLTKELKRQLFNEGTAVVFINVLQQIGKIQKVSKNMPGVFGYSSTELLGLSINELLPQALRPFHDQTVTRFVQGYSGGKKRQAGIQFYGINKNRNLTKVKVHFHWVMTNFDSFQLAGVAEKLQSETQIILTDQNGFLQGWTKTIGEELCFDEIVANKSNFNILPLFPTLIKYNDSLGVWAKSIFFKPTKSGLQRIMNLKSYDQKILLKTFNQLANQQQLVGGCFAQIQYFKLSLCGGQAKMRQITIYDYDKIQNMPEVLELIQKIPKSGSSLVTQRIIKEGSEISSDAGQKQQMSVFSEDEKADNKIDSNFSTDPQGVHLFPMDVLAFGHFTSSRSSFQISKMLDKSAAQSNHQQNQKIQFGQIESALNPSLQRMPSLVWGVVLVTLVFLVLISLNMWSVYQSLSMMKQENELVLRRNRAAMIYYKSVFNPNQTYIKQFATGQLMLNEQYLATYHLKYTSYLGQVNQYNDYYLMNTQIPATLQRLLLKTGGTVQADTIPAVLQDYYRQITLNFQQILIRYHEGFSKGLYMWSEQIKAIRRNFYIKVGLMSLSALIYCAILIVVQYLQHKHRETLQAFFKFQKEDLQRKITNIGGVVRQVQNQVAEWHLLKDLATTVKNNQISNIDFQLIKHPKQSKIGFPYDIETQQKMQKQQYYHFCVVMVIFLVTLLAFLSTHFILTNQALNYAKNAPYELDEAAKLIILPNLLLSELYLPVPDELRSNYIQKITKVLNYPSQSIPSLYNMLSQPPCSSCSFMSPVLATNYKSFYLTFQERTFLMKNKTRNNTVIKDMFMAADVVVDNILKQLKAQDFKHFDGSIIVFLVALAVIIIGLYRATSFLNYQIERLQMFLGFFNDESITKNKHLNRLFDNAS